MDTGTNNKKTKRYRGKRAYNKKVNKSLNPNQKKEVNKIVKSVMKKEDEYKQYAGSGQTITYAGNFSLSSAGTFYDTFTGHIVQNTTDSGRIGDTISLKSIHMRLSLYNNTSNPYTTWRVVVFQFNASDSVVPDISKIFLSSTANGGTYGTFSPRNKDFFSIYNVLYDRVFSTDNITTTHKYVGFFVPLKYAKKKIQFIAAGTAGVNQIYWFVTTGSTSQTNNPSILYDYNVSYTDC